MGPTKGNIRVSIRLNANARKDLKGVVIPIL